LDDEYPAGDDGQQAVVGPWFGLFPFAYVEFFGSTSPGGAP
jgi:hypothetical protein